MVGNFATEVPLVAVVVVVVAVVVAAAVVGLGVVATVLEAATTKLAVARQVEVVVPVAAGCLLVDGSLAVKPEGPVQVAPCASVGYPVVVAALWHPGP